MVAHRSLRKVYRATPFTLLISLDGTAMAGNDPAMVPRVTSRGLRVCITLMLTLVLATCASSGDSVRERASQYGLNFTDQDIELVNSVIARIISNSLTESSSDDLIEMALESIRDAKDIPADRTRVDVGLNDMLKKVDEYADYLNPERTKRMRDRLRGNFEGIGIFIGERDDRIIVVTPIEGSPAMDAGLKPEDWITEIDGTTTEGLTVTEAASLLRGKRGTSVTVTVARGSESPRKYSITRALITVPTASSKRIGDIGYVRLSQFTETTEPGLEEAVNELVLDASGAPKGFILDLRNNPGGLASQATRVADAFLENGLIWSSVGRNGEGRRNNTATPGDIGLGRPLVILQNRGSASSSEIVAGGLRGNERAVILGTRSFGKGVAQTHFRLGSDLGMLKLTTMRFFQPDGTSNDKVGLQPDILVLQPNDEKDNDNHPLKGEAAGEKCPAISNSEPDDYQLRCAVALIRSGGVPAFLALYGTGS